MDDGRWTTESMTYETVRAVCNFFSSGEPRWAILAFSECDANQVKQSPK